LGTSSVASLRSCTLVSWAARVELASQYSQPAVPAAPISTGTATAAASRVSSPRVSDI
jgi:hypothetical protein